MMLFVVNLAPRKLRGLESNGMLMAVDGVDGSPVFLVPDPSNSSGQENKVLPGTTVH
jgi:tRNA-binding EMAP/Myf-like protein